MPTIKAFLDSLGSVATKPYAFVAYLVLIGAWIYVGTANQRLKIIARSISALPENERGPLLAREYNVLPKDGLSAEQWIRSRRQFLFFLAFLAFLVAGTALAVVAWSIPVGPELSPKEVSSLTSLGYAVQKTSPGFYDIERTGDYLHNAPPDEARQLLDGVSTISSIKIRREMLIDPATGKPFPGGIIPLSRKDPRALPQKQ